MSRKKKKKRVLRKGRSQISLYADSVWSYAKDSIRRFSGLINTVSNGTAHKKHHTSTGSFPLYNNEVSETEVRRTTQFTITSKTAPPPTKGIKYPYNRTKTKTYEERVWKTLEGRRHMLTGRINTENSKSNLHRQCNSLQILKALFIRIGKVLKLTAKIQKTQNNQSNHEQ